MFADGRQEAKKATDTVACLEVKDSPVLCGIELDGREAVGWK